MDEVRGTAILDDRGAEALFVICVPTPGKGPPFITRIPVRRASLPHAPGPEWAYTERANLLDVTPSLLVRSTRPIPGSPLNQEFELFHNGGFWTVPFLRWSTHQNDPGAAEGCWDWCRALNRDILGDNF